MAPLRKSSITRETNWYWIIDSDDRVRESRVSRLQSAGCRSGSQRYGDCESNQHGLDADRRVPSLRDAGRLHDAGGRVLPLSRDGERIDGVHRGYVPLRHYFLCFRLRVYVQSWERLHRDELVLSEQCAGNL